MAVDSSLVGVPAAASSAQVGSKPAVQETAVIRRVTLRIIPLLMICYLVGYLDRVNLSFAALQMNKALHLSATTYGMGVGVFFLTYCLFGVPSNLLLHRFGARRWIARLMLIWGVCAAAMAFVRGPYSFYALRLLLGAAEAGFYPGVLYFLTLWFPAKHRARILGLFIAGLPISGIIGAPLSGWLLSLNGFAGLQGWQWLFLIEGLPAVLLAPVLLAWIQDRPSLARWLPTPERDWLVSTLDTEQRQSETARGYSVIQALVHPWVLFLALTYFTNVCLLNGITFFLPQIVKSFGATDVQTGFIVAAPSVAALVALIWWGRRSDLRQERYGHAAAANAAGGAALLVAMLLHDPVARIAAITVAFGCTLAFTAPFWAIPGQFLTGASAAGGIGVISALGVLGGFLAPMAIGRLKDLTGDFRLGLEGVAVLAMVVSLPFWLIGRFAMARPAPGGG
jgi:MFS family permease